MGQDIYSGIFLEEKSHEIRNQLIEMSLQLLYFACFCKFYFEAKKLRMRRCSHFECQ